MTPTELIVAFINGLPNPTAEDVCSQILYAFDRTALRQLARDRITPVAPELKRLTIAVTEADAHVSRAVTVAALIDFAFAGSTITPEQWAQMAKEMDDPIVEQVAMRAHLTSRYFAQAREAWMKLRDAELSLASLRKFEAYQMAALAAGLQPKQ